MPVTRPVDVPDWIPAVISASFYDRMDDPNTTLTQLAARYNDLEGRPGQSIVVPTDVATTPAANLAVDVPAVDDSIASGAYTMLVKEGVKSIAWYDRTQIQSGQDVNQLAGRKVGNAMLARVELDLGTALVAGRATAKDFVSTGFTLATIRKLRNSIPARLRKQGVTIVASDTVMNLLLEDPAVNNAAAFGSSTIASNGQITGLYGTDLRVTDDTVIPDTLISGTTGPLAVAFANGMLAYGFQKNPTVEQERDARARLTRQVGSMLHAEGTLEAAGIVACRVA